MGLERFSCRGATPPSEGCSIYPPSELNDDEKESDRSGMLFKSDRSGMLFKMRISEPERLVGLIGGELFGDLTNAP
jgi:hypothetical protein